MISNIDVNTILLVTLLPALQSDSYTNTAMNKLGNQFFEKLGPNGLALFVEQDLKIQREIHFLTFCNTDQMVKKIYQKSAFKN